MTPPPPPLGRTLTEPSSRVSQPSLAQPMERDPRFESQLIERTPIREICLAVFLLLLGTSMYVVALLCHYGHIHPKRVSVRYEALLPREQNENRGFTLARLHLLT